jgi:predicted ATPase
MRARGLGEETGGGFDSRPVRRVERKPSAEVDRTAWWAQIPAVAQVLRQGLDLPAGVTFLVGENGSGKSTLVEALAQAYGINPEGGSRGAMHSTRPSESPLGGVLRVIRGVGAGRHAYFLRAETMHGLYTYLENNPNPFRPSRDTNLHDRSHGEGFLDLLQLKFSGAGFYLMDEPEAPLSFVSTLSLMGRLEELGAAGAQLVIATHSPVLTALPGATILELSRHGLHRVDWSQLDIVANFRRFLDSPDSYLRHLRG